LGSGPFSGNIYFPSIPIFIISAITNLERRTNSCYCCKSLKEIAYHLRWSREWVIRLGDGTEESRQRMLKAIDELWRYTGEMFIPASYEKETWH
jgi:ring-1,2-phenylacetyl-CoA epoxidase subunit PaaC